MGTSNKKHGTLKVYYYIVVFLLLCIGVVYSVYITKEKNRTEYIRDTLLDKNEEYMKRFESIVIDYVCTDTEEEWENNRQNIYLSISGKAILYGETYETFKQTRITEYLITHRGYSLENGTDVKDMKCVINMVVKLDGAEYSLIFIGTLDKDTGIIDRIEVY